MVGVAGENGRKGGGATVSSYRKVPSNAVGDFGSSSACGSPESDMMALIVERERRKCTRNTPSLTEERDGYRSCYYANKLSDNRQARRIKPAPSCGGSGSSAGESIALERLEVGA